MTSGGLQFHHDLRRAACRPDIAKLPAGRCCLLLLSGLLGLAAATESARADFTLCNNTTSRVGVAIGYQGPKGWATEGWWTITSKSCETLLKGKLPNRFYYIHAVDYDRGGEWSGPSSMCVKDKSFIIRGVEQCERRGGKKTGFFEVDTGNAKHWSVNLSDPVEAAQKAK